jgi:hypothetical protein
MPKAYNEPPRLFITIHSSGARFLKVFPMTFQFPWILEIRRRTSCLLLRHPYHPWIVSSWCFLPMRVARLCYQTKLPSATAATKRTTNRKVSSLRASLAARKRNSRENSEMPPQVRKERPRVMKWDGGKKRDRLRSERKCRLHRYRMKTLVFLTRPDVLGLS